MSLMRYLFHDLFTAHEFNRIEEEGKHRRRAQRRRNAEQRRKIEDLEEDIGQLALVTRTLAELVVQKGVATSEELQQLLSKTDLLDGSADGRLDAGDAAPGPASDSD